MIASASDDMTIRIWGTRQQAEQQQCYIEEKEAKMIAEDQKNQSRCHTQTHDVQYINSIIAEIMQVHQIL